MSKMKIIAVPAMVIVLIIIVFSISMGYYQPGKSGENHTSVIEGYAGVDEVEIIILESFPVQVHVVARGDLPDSCTEIYMVTTTREDDTFFITVTTQRPANAMCAQVLTPFEEVIPLDVVGLKAGIYRVDVNGVNGTFELQVDNILQPEGALSVSELLKEPLYDTEVRVYGKVSLLGELFCPCFELASGGDKVVVWYDLMMENDRTERPPVNVETVHNGDWVIVTGELKLEGQHRSLNDFWASNIERIG